MMSGGAYEYIQYRIEQAADEVDSTIRSCDPNRLPDEFGCKPDYSKETLAKFRECEQTLRKAAAMLQRVDWLVSGDDGEDSFHSRWDEELAKLVQ